MIDPGAVRVTLAQVTGERVVAVELLSGGASRHTFSATLQDAAGRQWPVVAQRRRSGSLELSCPVEVEGALVSAAAACGVPVAPVLAVHSESDEHWVVYGWVDGETIPRRILRDHRYRGARAALSAEVAAAAAALHSIPVSTDGLDLPHPDPLGSLRAVADSLDEPHPAFEIGFRWLEAHRPRERDPVVLHGDLRLGNLIVDEDGLAAVVDWELAHLGNPVEDLGWFCVRSWRFGSSPRAGGVGSAEQLLDAYAESSGHLVTHEELDWWEAYGTLRWGVICVAQARAHLGGHVRSVELATIGRRAAECEWDLLELVSPEVHGP